MNDPTSSTDYKMKNNHIPKAVIQSTPSTDGRRKPKNSFKENRNGFMKITNRFASLNVEESHQANDEHDPINTFLIGNRNIFQRESNKSEKRLRTKSRCMI